MASGNSETSAPETHLRRMLATQQRGARRTRSWRRSRLESRRGGLTADRFRRSWWAWALFAVSWLGVGLLVAQAVFVILDLFPKWVSGIMPVLGPYAAAGLAYIVFYFWREKSVIQYYQNQMRDEPGRMVPTAPSDLTEVIGREELCSMLLDNLHSNKARPNMIVGGMGAGKTAVLVRLAQRIAELDGVPVAIRLRDADNDLDFEQLARDRFAEVVNSRLRAAGNADRIWRGLRREKRVVVLADGLEEALARTDPGADRQSMVQTAIRRAAESGLPLIIAARFCDPLQRLELTVTELEPLGEGPALDFLARGEPTARLELARLIQTANVAHSPTYLNVIQQLNQRDKLRHLTPDKAWLQRVINSAGSGTNHGYVDQTRQRLTILDSWRDALQRGLLYENFAVPPTQRKKAIQILSVLACFGVARGSLEVPFDVIDDEPGSEEGRKAPSAQELRYQRAAEYLIEMLRDVVFEYSEVPDDTSPKRVLDLLKERCVDAALIGSELGIVAARDTSVRFRQGIIEAYLAADSLPKALENEHFSALAFDTYGREFLTALVLASRRGRTVTGPAEPDQPSSAQASTLLDGPDTVAKLCAAAERELKDEVKLYLYEAAVEIDAIQDSPQLVAAGGASLVECIARSLRMIREVREKASRMEGRRAVDAKIALVQRIGQSAQEVAQGMPATLRKDDQGQQHTDEMNDKVARDLGPVYRCLFDIAKGEAEHAVKLAIAQEIADGKADAFKSLTNEFTQWRKDWLNFRTRRPDRGREHGSRFARSHEADADAEDLMRRGEICAWLAPLFCSTIFDSNGTDDPLDNLDKWIEDYLCWLDPQNPEGRPWISLEVALAQGFMLAANRRPAAAERYEKRRSILVEKAERTLQFSRFWFAQLTLIQALTLLSLPSDGRAALHDRGHGSDPQALVDSWLAIAGSGFAEREHQAGHRVHPFVRRIGELAVHALNTRRPERFCWVDESGTIKQVGSLPRPGSRPLEHRLWLLPSFGWSSLHPDARHLLGDVQVMLNLANRGNQRSLREARLAKSERPELPPCITHDRAVMRVEATVGSAEVSVPGSSCHDDCQFRLCPYPPLGQLSYRDELPEGFCRHLSQTAQQQSYERGLGRKAVRTFWAAMVERVLPKIQYQGKPSTSRLKK